MKKLFFIISAIIFLSSTQSFSQDKNFGIGVMLGEPTGISAKYWLNNTNAFDYGLGTSFAGDSRVHIHVDYVWHAYDVFKSSEKIVLYYGPGLRVKTFKYGDSVLGIRGVAGAAWFLRNSPIDVFVELVPVLNIIPDFGMSVNGGAGVRYFFN